MPVAQVKAKVDGEAKQKHLLYSRQQDAVVSILRTANYLDRFCAPMFDQHGITSQQFNVLRILRGAGLGGASDTGHRREDDRTGTGYNPLAGSAGTEEARAPGTPFR
jgi:hypothetical protein